MIKMLLGSTGAPGEEVSKLMFVTLGAAIA